jgi:hypothetical protein
MMDWTYTIAQIGKTANAVVLVGYLLEIDHSKDTSRR